MDVKRNLLVLIAICSFVIVQPLNAYADKCADIMDKAGDIFDNALSASKQENYDEAIRLYEEAAKYYKKASKMHNCRCPKTGNAATENIRFQKRTRILIEKD